MWPPAPSTTWLFVTITPSEEMTKPVPAPPPSLWSPVAAPPVRMATTEGSTFERMLWMSVASAIAEVLRAALLGWRTITVRVALSSLVAT